MKAFETQSFSLRCPFKLFKVSILHLMSGFSIIDLFTIETRFYGKVYLRP